MTANTTANAETARRGHDAQAQTSPAPAPDGDPTSLAASMRGWATFLSMWRVCGKRACRRARACRGDVRACFKPNYGLLPEGVRLWFDGVGAAQEHGLTFDEAMEWLDATEAGDAIRDWFAAVANSLGEESSVPVRWWVER